MGPLAFMDFPNLKKLKQMTQDQLNKANEIAEALRELAVVKELPTLRQKIYFIEDRPWLKHMQNKIDSLRKEIDEEILNLVEEKQKELEAL